MSDEDAAAAEAMEAYRFAHVILEGKFGPARAEALAHLRTAADHWGRALRSKQRAEVLIELGKLHQELGDDATAVTVYEEALKIHKDNNDKPAMAYAAVLAGLALKALGKYELALGFLE